VEHGMKNILIGNDIELPSDKIELLDAYSRLLFEENDKHNVTGLKSLLDVQEVLILKSIEPVKDLIVPRGTRFADVGTGPGIPGIVIAICFTNFEGTLFDSNNKKTDFIAETIQKLGITNIKVCNGRIEDIGHDIEYREKFDWCFTRAFGPLVHSIEFGLPLLKTDGLLYIYSNLQAGILTKDIFSFITKNGGNELSFNEFSRYGLKEKGLLIKKIIKSNDLFPRRFPVVKREAARIKESIQDL
jgi:16S rRNA (guanine527-N7)-methyltransferase